MGIRTKLNYEYVKTYIESIDGYKLLSKEYINIDSKLVLQCPHNHNYEVSFYQFRNRNSRCGICVGNQKFTKEEVQSYLQTYNYKLLSTEYYNASTLLEMQCPNNHVVNIRLYNFKTGYRCRHCYFNDNTGEYHANWNPHKDINQYIRKTFSPEWKRENMKDDLNYSNWLKNPTKYELDHKLPIKEFAAITFDKNLNIDIIREIANHKRNLHFITKQENRRKKAKCNKADIQEYIDAYYIKGY